MKRVRIDFAPPSLRRTLFRTPAAARVLAVAAVAVGVGAALVGQRYLHELRAYEAQLAAAHARTRAPAVVQVAVHQPPVPTEQANAVNTAILQLNLPWRALRDAVQAATPPHVALLALEPDARKRSLRITAEARGSDEMIDYVQQLASQDWFTSVSLARHEINDQDPNRPIRFQVDAQWRAQ